MNKEKLKLIYCKIEEQATNILIKPLKINRFENLRSMFGMMSLNVLDWGGVVKIIQQVTMVSLIVSLLHMIGLGSKS